MIVLLPLRARFCPTLLSSVKVEGIANISIPKRNWLAFPINTLKRFNFWMVADCVKPTSMA